MHESSMLRMEYFVKNYVSNINKKEIRVLDIGSYDVNGSYKKYFSDAKFKYDGLDMVEGPNVDIVMNNPYCWENIPDDSYDVVISGQAFEHAEFFWVLMEEMTRVLKKDGLMCIIVPRELHEHRYPVDCYRFLTDGMIALARYASLEVLHAHSNSGPKGGGRVWYSENGPDSMLIAKKNYENGFKRVDLSKYTCVPAEQDRYLDGFVKSKKTFLKRCLRSLLERISG